MNHPAELQVLRKLLSLSNQDSRSLIHDFGKAAHPLHLLNRASSRAPIVPMALGLNPFVVSREHSRQIQALVRAVFRFQLKIPSLYQANFPNLRRICFLEPSSASWFKRLSHLVPRRPPAQSCGDHEAPRQKPRDCPSGLPEARRPDQVLPFRDLLIRADVGLAARGQIPVLYETNATALGGMLFHAMGVKVMEDLILKDLGLSRSGLRIRRTPDLLDYLWRWLGSPSDISTALVEDLPFNDSYSEIPWIAQYFRKKGAGAVHGHPRQLRLKGGRVYLHGRAVDQVFRDMTFKDMGRCPRFGRRKYAGLIELLNRRKSFPGISGEFDHKGILECLTSPHYQSLFSPREVRLFKKYVPWTRVLWERRTENPEGKRVDLFEYVRKSKDSLILKPNQSAGGEGVLFGVEANQAQWERALEKAHRQESRWVTQKYVESSRRWMAYVKDEKIHFENCYFSIGVFYSSQGPGYHCRVSRSNVVNVARGGALACVYVG
ncbi:MAG: hypothetical protein HY399_06280 [Elusimicrobia bacterium]|nr:hypothetical protein [Elusimicrobiota bacterium]